MLDAVSKSLQIDPAQLDALGADELRALARELLERTGRDAKAIVWRDAKIDKLTFEIAQLRRLQYSAKSEQLSAEQKALFDEALDSDIAAIEEQLAALKASQPPKNDGNKQTPQRCRGSIATTNRTTPPAPCRVAAARCAASVRT